jgi:mono/diheme cytochrome c family protein
MKAVKTLLVILVAIACVSASTSGAMSQAPASAAQTSATAAGDAQAGKDLYLRYSCYACHGYAGHGGAGARLVPLRMPLPAFTAYLRSPRQMPPYTAKVLSDSQVSDVWAYIQTLPRSPAAKDIPLLNQILSEK